jgi:hypothetical protein
MSAGDRASVADQVRHVANHRGITPALDSQIDTTTGTVKVRAQGETGRQESATAADRRVA